MQVSIEEIMESSGVRFGTSGARGLVERMGDKICYAYTAAFIQGVVGGGPVGDVVLGHDLRPSSPRIASACAAAVRDAGGQVVYSGKLPTPALAWYANLVNAPAIIVTGSHIPFDRNGIKFYRADGEISKKDEAAIQSAVVSVSEDVAGFGLPEADARALKEYVRRYVDFFGAGAFYGMRIAVYEHSSVARDVLRTILELLGAHVISLGRTDVFVPIDTEAVRHEDVRQARIWATEHGFDAILSTDGDADRPLVGDENGNWFRGDVVGILCARFLNADIVVTPVSSNTAVETGGWFGKVIRTSIGSPFVIDAMIQARDGLDGVIVGFEANGGFLLGSNISRGGKILGALPTRDAVLPMLALLSLARARGCKLSELQADIPQRYTASNRLQNFAIERSAALIARLKNDENLAMSTLAPESGRISHVDTTDGLRVTFDNADIVHLRASGNAPELRCYTEANTQSAAQMLCAACLGRLI